MKQKKKWLIWAAVAVIVLLAGFRIVSKMGHKQSQAEVPIAVAVQHPVLGEAMDTLELSGTVSAKEEANAYSKVMGKVVRYDRSEGDYVNKNDIIAWVERDEIGLTYSLSPVRAPISGVVAERYIDIGESVTSGMGGPGTPVAQVVNPAHLETTVYLVEKEVGRVQIGQTARIRVQAYPGEIFTGRVKRISPVVSQVSRTTQVKLGLDPSGGKLKSGMLADVEIVVGQREQAMLLPREVVLRQNRKQFVYVVEGKKVARKDVETGWFQQDTVEILSGLKLEDAVIVRGQTRVTEGTTVQIAEQGD